MSGGRIVEEGTHEELSARGEVYAGLYARQSLVEATAEEAG
jgi:ATP-binding cassette subfamily B multidrug efflux pump